MKVSFSDSNKPISIIEFLGKFKLDGDTNKIHERAAMWVFRHRAEETLTNALNSRMRVKHRLSPVPASVRNKNTRSCKLLKFYSEVANHLWKKYAFDQAIVETVAATLRYAQPSNMTTQKYTNNLIAKPCRVVDLNNESTPDDVFIGSVDASVRHSLHTY